METRKTNAGASELALRTPLVIEQFHRWHGIAVEIREGVKLEQPEDAMDEFWRAVSEVDLHGSTEAAEKALAVYLELRKQVNGPRSPHDSDDDLDLTGGDRHYEFVNTARADLGLPARFPPTPYIEGPTGERIE